MERIPSDIQKVLRADPQARARWNELTPIARRDFVSWAESAKQPETRRRRVESIPSRLASGKRRPCCYALVPLKLYSSLNANPKAKANWKTLGPDGRRDFVDWIDSVKDPAERTLRIFKACDLLAAGKRRP